MYLGSLTASRALCYLHCPAKYYYRYVEKLEKSVSAKMMLGSSFHSTCKLNYRQKAETRRDLRTSDLCEYFASEFDFAAPETEFDGEDPGQMKDSGIGVVRAYQSEIAPAIQPVEVEEDFVMNFSNVEWNYQGKVDLVTEDDMVNEIKTTSRGLSSPKADHVIQISGYFEAYKRMKKKELRARLDYAIMRNAGTEIKKFDLDLGDREWRYFLSLLSHVAKGVAAEVWTPNRIDNFCSKKFCSYWQECEAENGGYVR